MKLPPALPPIAWKPHPGSQVLFLSCPVFECLLEGTRGGGKTDALLMSFAQFVGQGFGPAWRGVLFRETYPQLADVVKKSKRWFRLFWPAAKFNESDFRWTFPDGEELLLRHGVNEDDYWNYHGHEFCVGIDTPVRTEAGWLPIGELRPGDRVWTLDGVQAVTRVFSPKVKECVRAYVYDDHRNLVGVQVQSVDHRLLTTARTPCLESSASSHSDAPGRPPSSSWQAYTPPPGVHPETPEASACPEGRGSCDTASRLTPRGAEPPARSSRLAGPHAPRPDQVASRRPESTRCLVPAESRGSWQGSSESLRAGFLGRLPHGVQVQSWQDRGASNAVSGAPHSMATAPDSPAGCRPSGGCDGAPPPAAQETGPDGAPSRAGAAAPVRVSLLADASGTARTHSPDGDEWSFDHPYTGAPVRAVRQVSGGWVVYEPCGPQVTVDVCVETSNHYVTATGLINKNCWIGFEELTNWRDSGFYEAMQSCCRSSQQGMPRMVRATTNPYGRGHSWVKERFALGRGGASPGAIRQDPEGRPRTYVHSDVHENLELLKNDPDYLATLQGTKDPNRRKAWLYGDWDINIGAFLEGAWDPQKHIVKPFQIPSHWKVWMAMDWGYGKPYCVLWFAKDPEGKTYIFREMYGIAKDDKTGKPLPNVGSKETPDKVAKRIKDREQHDERLGIEMSLRITGPDLFAKGGGQYGVQNTHAMTFRREGLAFRPWWAGPGSRKAGAMLVKQALELDQLAVFSTCEHWLRTVPTLEPDPDDPDDVDTEAEDHAFDTTKAGLMRRTSTPDAPPSDDAPDPGKVYEAEVLADGTHRIARGAARVR